MIKRPHRSVTRFFIPMIDVLILLFCIFLLMPFVSQGSNPNDDPEAADIKETETNETLPKDVRLHHYTMTSFRDVTAPWNSGMKL